MEALTRVPAPRVRMLQGKHSNVSVPRHPDHRVVLLAQERVERARAAVLAVVLDDGPELGVEVGPGV